MHSVGHTGCHKTASFRVTVTRQLAAIGARTVSARKSICVSQLDIGQRLTRVAVQ
jgi:hypothetical protein